jgi:hypothetical protein
MLISNNRRVASKQKGRKQTAGTLAAEGMSELLEEEGTSTAVGTAEILSIARIPRTLTSVGTATTAEILATARI